jgi:hypothetical protein
MTRVNPVRVLNSSANPFIQSNFERHIASMAIESEKVDHEIKSEKRIQVFKDILSNTPWVPSTVKYALYGLSPIFIILVSTSPLTLVPMHNIFDYPSYWYETPLQSMAMYLGFEVSNIMCCSYFMNIGYIKMVRHFFIVGIGVFLGTAILYPTGYIIWTQTLEYPYPIPWTGAIYGYSILAIIWTMIWLRFPTGWRKNAEFRKRFKSFLVSIIFIHSIYVHYRIITKALLTLQNQYQWVIAILLPFIRELENLIAEKLALGSARGDVMATKMVIYFFINTYHTVTLTYAIGALANDTSSLIVLICDFLFNLLTALRIIWMVRKRPENKEAAIALLQELVIVEMVEFIIPLVYLACFCTAYYGPNAELLGNITNEDFHFVAVEDPFHTIKNVGFFFCFDAIALTTLYFVAWFACRIDLFRVYTALLKEFGLVFLAILVGSLTSVSNNRIKGFLITA